MVVPAFSGLLTRAAIPAMGGAFATDKGNICATKVTPKRRTLKTFG